MKLLNWIVFFLTLLVTLMSVAGLFGQFSSWLDMFSHFRIVYLGALLILCGALLLLKNWTFLVFGAVALIFSSFPVLSMYAPMSGAHHAANSSKIRILQINPQADKNHQTNRVIDYALQMDPDILAITELSKEWKDALKARLESYKFQIIEGRFDTGIALFSKLPIENYKVRYYPGVPLEHPQIECRVWHGNQLVTVILAHTTLPKKLVASRDTELRAIAERAKQSDTPVIVFGDLNCGPWSYHFNQLMLNGKLIDTEQGFGPQPSWTTEMIIPLVPIDHVLTSRDFSTCRRCLGPNIGSDHLPVYVELALPGDATENHLFGEDK